MQSGIPEATYIDPGLPEYADNPLICALPPMMSRQEVAELLKSRPAFDKSEINLPDHIRIHAIARLSTSFFQPLSTHIALELKISLMLRQGYLGRNPQNAMFKKHLNNGYERIIHKNLDAYMHDDVDSTASSMALFGVSGSGKTSTVDRILKAYPKALYHPEFNMIQIPWLKVDCPHDGTLTEFCLSFFMALDRRLGTDYLRKYGGSRKGIGYLITSAAQLANIHAIGLLVIDEFQHLDLAKGGGEKKMINFLVKLVNTIGVSVLLIGTPKALPIFAGEFRKARRSAGQGSVAWDRLKRDASWERFVDELWKYQWLKNKQPLTQAIRDKLYDLSQGVIDILIKLMCLSQARAILIGKDETITTGLLQQVYDDEFKTVHKMLSALKNGRAQDIQQYGDLVMPEIEDKLIQSFDHLIAVTENPTPTNFKETEEIDKAKKAVKMLTEMGVSPDISLPLVDDILSKCPSLSIIQLVHKATSHVTTQQLSKDKTPVPNRRNREKIQWDSLQSNDLRKLFTDNNQPLYQALKNQELIFDIRNLQGM